MKTKIILTGPLLLLLLFAIVIPARAQTTTPRQTLNQYVADLQKSPDDTALRQKIIAIAKTMRPAPAIPEEARGHYVMAATFMEKAKDNTGFERAVEQYKAALLAAPWWADAYRKLATAQKAAERYDDAVASLNLYLLTQPADARDAQDEIYKLKALKESAADDQKKAAEKGAEEKRAQQAAAQAAADQAQRQREEQQRAWESSPEGRFQALLKKIDGRRYTIQATDGGTAVLEVRGNVLVSGYIGVKGDYHAFIPNHIEIKSRETIVPSNENPFGQVSGTYVISEDGNSIAVSARYNDSSVRGPNVYLWQR